METNSVVGIQHDSPLGTRQSLMALLRNACEFELHRLSSDSHQISSTTSALVSRCTRDAWRIVRIGNFPKCPMKKRSDFCRFDDPLAVGQPDRFVVRSDRGTAQVISNAPHREQHRNSAPSGDSGFCRSRKPLTSGIPLRFH
jgi:hypothetical protein